MLPAGPGETDALAPLLEGDSDKESSEGEGGAASTSNAFSRIDLPSLYFWDCSYALSWKTECTTYVSMSDLGSVGSHLDERTKRLCTRVAARIVA